MNTLEQDIQLAKAGNQEAFGRLYNETVKIAYYVAKRVLVNENEEAVEDVLQESYIAVFKNLDKYTSGNFQGWVDTIVANRCKNYLRKKNPLLFSQLADEDGKEMEFEEENLEFRPDAKTDYEETKRLVLEIIDNLPEEQRLSVILFYYEQLSVKEIAKVCECSENTIKSRLNYGRKAIKEEVLKLEKKGTKLYCAPLLPFLFWLFSQEAKACEMPKGMLSAEKVLETAMAEGTAGGSAVAGGTTAAGASTSGSVAGNGAVASGMVNGAATGGVLAVKTAGLSMAAKIAIGIAAAAVVTGTAVGIVTHNTNKKTQPVVQEQVEDTLDLEEEIQEELQETEPEVLEEQQEETTYPIEVTGNYQNDTKIALEEMLKTLVLYVKDGESISAGEMDDAAKATISHMMFINSTNCCLDTYEDAGLLVEDENAAYFSNYFVTAEKFEQINNYIWKDGFSADNYGKIYLEELLNKRLIGKEGDYYSLMLFADGENSMGEIISMDIAQTSANTCQITAEVKTTYNPDMDGMEEVYSQIIVDAEMVAESPLAGMTITRVQVQELKVETMQEIPQPEEEETEGMIQLEEEEIEETSQSQESTQPEEEVVSQENTQPEEEVILPEDIQPEEEPEWDMDEEWEDMEITDIEVTE